MLVELQWHITALPGQALQVLEPGLTFLALVLVLVLVQVLGLVRVRVQVVALPAPPATAGPLEALCQPDCSALHPLERPCRQPRRWT